jgi:DNA repair exonuclease SbcCD nuclease subunit
MILNSTDDPILINTVLAIGDPHFKVANVAESEQMTVNLIKVASQINPTFIVDLGDTLHRHETIHVAPLMRAENMLKQLSQIAPTYILIGNHDRPNNSNFLTDEHPFNALKEWHNMKVVDTTYEAIHNDQRFIFVPYVPPGRFQEALDRLTPSTVKEMAIFAHQEFYGAKMGAIVSNDGDKWPLENSLIVSGHIHDYDEPQPNIIYTGTPMQHAFGDRSDKTVSIFRFYSNGTWKQERIDLGLIKREIKYLRPDQVHDFMPDPNKLIKVVIKGEDSEIKGVVKLEKIKELKKMGVMVAFKTMLSNDDPITNSTKSNHISFLDRLFSEISNDAGQVRWFKKIFYNNTSNVPAPTINIVKSDTSPNRDPLMTPTPTINFINPSTPNVNFVNHPMPTPTINLVNHPTPTPTINLVNHPTPTPTINLVNPTPTPTINFVNPSGPTINFVKPNANNGFIKLNIMSK